MKEIWKKYANNHFGLRTCLLVNLSTFSIIHKWLLNWKRFDKKQYALIWGKKESSLILHDEVYILVECL